ncbi:MAG: hypothetical protein ACYDAY_10830 [Candidatus Dormibacteria bacterium]
MKRVRLPGVETLFEGTPGIPGPPAPPIPAPPPAAPKAARTRPAKPASRRAAPGRLGGARKPPAEALSQIEAQALVARVRAALPSIPLSSLYRLQDLLERLLGGDGVEPALVAELEDVLKGA